jgi:hypothetical protein
MPDKFDGFVPTVKKLERLEPTPYSSLAPKAEVQEWRQQFGAMQTRGKFLEKRQHEMNSEVLLIMNFYNEFLTWCKACFESLEIVNSGLNQRVKALEDDRLVFLARFEVMSSRIEELSSLLDDDEPPYDDRTVAREHDAFKYE